MVWIVFFSFDCIFQLFHGENKSYSCMCMCVFKKWMHARDHIPDGPISWALLRLWRPTGWCFWDQVSWPVLLKFFSLIKRTSDCQELGWWEGNPIQVNIVGCWPLVLFHHPHKEERKGQAQLPDRLPRESGHLTGRKWGSNVFTQGLPRIKHLCFTPALASWFLFACLNSAFSVCWAAPYRPANPVLAQLQDQRKSLESATETSVA